MLKVLKGLQSLGSIHRQAEDAIKKLNSCLLTITEVTPFPYQSMVFIVNNQSFCVYNWC